MTDQTTTKNAKTCHNCGGTVRYDRPGTLQGDAWAAGICPRLMLAVASVDALPCIGKGS